MNDTKVYVVVRDTVEKETEYAEPQFLLTVEGPDGEELWDVDRTLWDEVCVGAVIRHSDEMGFWLKIG